MNIFTISILCLAFASCSPKETVKESLTVRYSDMSAAEDAGKTPSPTLNNKTSY
jgi:hypothetical protein